jgi:hypothetical protein
VLVSGPLAKDLYTLTAETPLAGITGLKLEALPDPSLPSQGPGRAKNGNFVLHELKLSIGPKGDAAKAEPVPLQGGSASFSQANFSAAAAIDGPYRKAALSDRARLAEKAGDKATARTSLQRLLELEGSSGDSAALERRIEALK